jgi:ABC-type nitrate/sulfonate/bicarbonate transport system permease component
MLHFARNSGTNWECLARSDSKGFPVASDVAATTNKKALAPAPAKPVPGLAERIFRVLARPRVYRSLISLAVFLIGWELVGRYVLTNRLFFVPISDVAIAFVKLTLNGELETNIAASFKAIGYGMALAIVVGISFGILLGASRAVADYTEVYVNALYSTPLVAIAPLLILWLGIGLGSKIAVVFLISVFPIIISTASGVRNVDTHYLDVAKAFGATRSQVVVKVLIPAGLPFVITGVRLAIGRAIVGVVIGELFGANAGLGYLIFTAGQTFDVPALFVGVICLAFAGVSLTWILQRLEKRLIRWKPVELED